MEMQRGRLISQRVQHIDDDLVTDICCDGWDGPFPIDANRGPIKGAIWVCSNPTDFEVVCNGGCLDYSGQGADCQQKET